ncbi:MAG TPA: hypothetical protein VMB81_18210 [Candidatus Sulfotelmatobacter sp.]|nr:hypothetical protein [Candidatus Sulfotelmatobacter sp.]
MRNSDIDRKVREAVVAARGDGPRAVNLLMKAAQQDPALLYAFTAPYLQGILFHAVQETLKKLKGAAKAKATGTATAPRKRELSQEAMDALIDEMRNNIPSPPPPPPRPPRNAAEALASLGRDPNGPPPPKAGKRHQTAMHTLAKSFKFKPRRGS